MRALVVLVWVASLCAGCSDGGRAATDSAVVEVFGPYRGEEADHLAEVLADFERTSGVEVRYTGSADFVADLRARTAEAGDPPDIAVIPQVGLVHEMASDGWIEPLADDTAASVASDFDPSVRALAEVDGQLVAIPFRLTLKSLVWYRPEVFAAHGWEVPHTLGELETLARAIETDGSLSPWCFGLESGSATGWAATDWTEDLVLRLLGPDTYREWAQGRLPFADPGIAEAFDMFSRLVLAPGRTQGGISGILETPVDTAAQGLFGAGAGCAMSKQADSAAGSMPPGTTFEPGGDVDVFVLPGVDEDQPAPLVVGSDQIVQFTHSASVDAVMHHLAGTRAAETWAEHGGFLSPNLAVPPSAYPPGLAASLSQRVRDTSVIALDASDQMPPDVGSGVLWDEITGWIAGATSYEEFAARVDAARADAGT